MTRVARPRRPRPGDVEVVEITPANVERMYTGIRRASAARLRWRDVDLAAGTVKVKEKGGKVSRKPVPNELLEILR